MSKKPFRVLFDAHSLLGRKTGVGYYTDQLVRELAHQHPEVEFIGYYHNFLYRKHTPSLPTAPNIRYRRIAFMPGQIVNLLRRFHVLLPIELLTLTRADFILYPNFLGLASLFHTPSATVIHDATFVDVPEYVSKRNLHDLQRFIPAQIKRSSFLITVSEFGKKRLCEEFGLPADSILVTPVPPEPVRKQTPTLQKDALQQLGINGKYILTLGTVEPRKNIPNMLDAYLQLPDAMQQQYTFVIAGGIGWNCEREVEQLEQLKQQGKNILHVGYVSEEQRAALYNNAALFTWASYYEGFGMPILEAMSYGTPCAISEIAVFREVAGNSALYFNQRSPESIASAWVRLLTDTALHQQLSAAGKQCASAYHWNDVADSLYQRIVTTLPKERT